MLSACKSRFVESLTSINLNVICKVLERDIRVRLRGSAPPSFVQGEQSAKTEQRIAHFKIIFCGKLK